MRVGALCLCVRWRFLCLCACVRVRVFVRVCLCVFVCVSGEHPVRMTLPFSGALAHEGSGWVFGNILHLFGACARERVPVCVHLSAMKGGASRLSIA
jgi:hypothetical protein